MALSVSDVKERLGHGGVSEIAKASGRSVSHVSRVLNGERADRQVARRVARRLGVRLADLPAEYVGSSPAPAA